MRPAFFKAKKTECLHGHKHDSKAESDRCNVLHHDQLLGKIDDLEVHPEFLFEINGTHVKMANGHKMKFTADFSYWQDETHIVEDVKPKGGFDNKSREVPVKLALLKHLYPEISWSIYK